MDLCGLACTDSAVITYHSNGIRRDYVNATVVRSAKFFSPRRYARQNEPLLVSQIIAMQSQLRVWVADSLREKMPATFRSWRVRLHTRWSAMGRIIAWHSSALSRSSRQSIAKCSNYRCSNVDCDEERQRGSVARRRLEIDSLLLDTDPRVFFARLDTDAMEISSRNNDSIPGSQTIQTSLTQNCLAEKSRISGTVLLFSLSVFFVSRDFCSP